MAVKIERVKYKLLAESRLSVVEALEIAYQDFDVAELSVSEDETSIISKERRLIDLLDEAKAFGPRDEAQLFCDGLTYVLLTARPEARVQHEARRMIDIDFTLLSGATYVK